MSKNGMTRYIIKRVLYMFLVLFIIMTMCFILIKLLPLPAVREMGRDINLVLAKREKMGYNKPIMVQYFLCFKLGWFPLQAASLSQAGGSLFSWTMFVSLIPAVLSLGFGVVAGLTRYTRAELSEVLTGDYMLLARTKGLTKAQAISRHALRNAMVVILPMIIGEFIGILGGSMIIENIFGIPGIGNLYINSINVRDYNFFMALNVFYTAIGLVSGIVIDISYGFIDPRIRMGSKK